MSRGLVTLCTLAALSACAVPATRPIVLHSARPLPAYRPTGRTHEAIPLPPVPPPSCAPTPSAIPPEKEALFREFAAEQAHARGEPAPAYAAAAGCHTPHAAP